MSTEQQSNVYVSERFQNPAALMRQEKYENFTWAAIIACVSTLLFVILLAIQWFDWSALKIA